VNRPRALLLLCLSLGCAGDKSPRPGASDDSATPITPTRVFVDAVWSLTPESTRSPQHHVTLASGAGQLAATWDEETLPPGGYLRLFTPDGAPATELQRFTRCPEDVPCRPDVVATADGYWVGWADDAGVHAARFDTALNRIGDTTTLQATPDGQRLEAPDLAPAPDGGVIAVWFSSDRLEGGETARYRLSRVRPDGSVSPWTELDVGLSGGSPPDVAPTVAGTAVTWVTREPEGEAGVRSTVWLLELDTEQRELSRTEVWTSATVVTRPMVAADGDDRAVVWREDRPERVSWLRMLPSGVPPHPPTLLLDGTADKPVVELMRGLAVVAFDVLPAPASGTVLLQPFDLASGTPLHDAVPVWGGGGSEQRPALTTDGRSLWVGFREEPEGPATPGNIRVAHARVE
jgi:hypothetical protein